MISLADQFENLSLISESMHKGVIPTPFWGYCALGHAPIDTLFQWKMEQDWEFLLGSRSLTILSFIMLWACITYKYTIPVYEVPTEWKSRWVQT